MFHHLTDAGSRRDQSNIVLVHYADLLHDLRGEMRRIATGLQIDVTREQIEKLARAATFESMQANGEDLAPDPERVLQRHVSLFFEKASLVLAPIH